MPRIDNPILRGFNPDPSIVRVGDEYFIATSTFEFQPAVRIHRSTDLASWEVAGHALENLDLNGIPDSGGVWAPSLSYSEGEFWLAYSVVHTMDGDDKDIENWLVTGPSPLGPWSEPVFLGSRGFDFSFFHDDDGTHWIVGVQWDHRPGFPSFSGIVVEQYLPELRRTSGEAHRIYSEAGHGELVQPPSGRWILVHLAARPAMHLGERYGTLGRETCLQPIVFDDGWPRLAHGGHLPATSFVVDAGSEPTPRPSSWSDAFDTGTLDRRRWSTLRSTDPVGDLAARPGWLRIVGGHTPSSAFAQPMVLTRVEEHDTVFEATVDAAPRTSREAAGIIAYYDRSGWIWLQVTHDDEHGRHLRVVRRDGRTTTRSAAIRIPEGELRMRAHLDGSVLRFAYRAGGEWSGIPGDFPAWTLSDDHGGRLRFTGMFLGLRAEDLDRRGWYADFSAVEVTARS